MSTEGCSGTPRQNVEVHGFHDAHTLVDELAAHFLLKTRNVAVHRFPDGESRVRVQSEGPRRAILVRSLDHANHKLLEVLFAADALRRSSVEELALVAPYLGYMRQDRAFHDGEAVSQHVIGQLLGNAFDIVVTLEAHLHRIRRLDEVIPCVAASYSAAPMIGTWCRNAGRFDVVVGPDAESEPWVRAVAAEANLPWSVCHKIRRSDREVAVEFGPLASEATSALIVDDIVSTGETLIAVTEKLKTRGFDRVEAAVVHALHDPATEDRLRAVGLDGFVSTDTLSHPTNRIATGTFLAECVEQFLASTGSA